MSKPKIWQKTVIPAAHLPRIAAAVRRYGSDSPLESWLLANQLVAAVKKENERCTACRVRRSGCRKTSLDLRQALSSAVVGRWSRRVNAVVPESRGAGVHAGYARIVKGIKVPQTRYETYYGDAPSKAYKYRTACSNAAVDVPVGWEIVEEDNACVVRRSRWYPGLTKDQLAERYIVRVSGKYGLRLDPAWYIRGFHVEAKNLKKARVAAAKLATERAASRRAEARQAKEQQAWLRAYGSEPMGIEDSIRSGNCRAGSEGWAQRYFPGRVSASIRSVLRAAKRSNEQRAEFAVAVAIRRAHHELSELALMSAIA